MGKYNIGKISNQLSFEACMFSDTNMKLYKFYQDYAVKMQVFVTHKFPHLEGSKKENLDYFQVKQTICV